MKEKSSANVSSNGLLSFLCPGRAPAQAGWPFWCPFRNVIISSYNCALVNQLRKAPHVKLVMTVMTNLQAQNARFTTTDYGFYLLFFTK